jgi:hypothetical protein
VMLLTYAARSIGVARRQAQYFRDDARGVHDTRPG